MLREREFHVYRPLSPSLTTHWSCPWILREVALPTGTSCWQRDTTSHLGICGLDAPEATPRPQLLGVRGPKHSAHVSDPPPAPPRVGTPSETGGGSSDDRQLAEEWDSSVKQSCDANSTKIEPCWGDSVILHFSKMTLNRIPLNDFPVTLKT